MADVADRHPAGVQRHDHRVEPVEAAAPFGTSIGVNGNDLHQTVTDFRAPPIH